jgi:hypothetical protein
VKPPRFERIITPLLIALVATIVAFQVLDPLSISGGDGPRPWPISPVPRDEPLIGLTTPLLARNSAQPWTPADLREVNEFERQVRRHADIVMWFADWESSGFDAGQAEAVRRRGSLPEISWEPWDRGVGEHRPQAGYRLARIIAGDHDEVVREFARGVAEYGHPVRLRFAQEMNARAYPWAERTNGNRPGEFARAWRHVHAIFQQEGATNVTWIWAPVVGEVWEGLYPGDGFVDAVGVSGFNGGTVAFGRVWRSFEELFGDTLDTVRRIAPGKPVVLPEIASAEAGGNKGAWIGEMFDAVRAGDIRAVVWFNLEKEARWQISSSDGSQDGFAANVSLRRRWAALSPEQR